MNIAIIMAGGSGTRFWPLSTKDTPKQLLKLFSDKTLLEETIDRLNRTGIYDKVYIVTGKSLEKRIRQTLKDFDNILIEPVSKDTSFCIAYSVKKIVDIYGIDTHISIFPSDHLIRNDELFKESIEKTLTFKDNIVIMGIKPQYPETAYGYIKYRDNDVIEFREKPNRETAEKYLEEGNYLWNSGMLFASSKVILGEIEKYLPKHYALSLDAERISFDIGVLEKTNLCKVVPVSFEWNDVGSFSSLDKVFEKNEQDSIIISKDKYLGLQSSKNIVINKEDGKNIVVVGLDDLIVVNTKDNLLICPKSKDQEIKKIAGIIDEK